uniref:Uncharacterized protein n=1 Tax=Amphimedon queenslandica TaxID=400682 RepID=A0A1X7SQ74_AMPQE
FTKITKERQGLKSIIKLFCRLHGAKSTLVCTVWFKSCLISKQGRFQSTQKDFA